MSSINYKMDKHSLNQGIDFNTINNKYLNIIGKKRLDLIEETTMDNMESLYENMDNMDGTLTKKEDNEISILRNLENEFNITLQEYKNTYKQYLEKSLSKNSNTKSNNINVIDGNNKKYFVNNYGYTRGYQNDNHWSSKPSSCLSTQPTPQSIDIYNSSKHGLDYQLGQPCNLDGKNIRNTKTNEVAWIDPQGKRHVYIGGQISGKNGCPNGEIKVDDSVYNMFPMDYPMGDSTMCFTTEQPDYLSNKIIQLNSRLMSIATEMNSLIDIISNEDNLFDSQVTQQKQTLLGEIKNLETENAKLTNMQNVVNKLNGELEETTIMTSSEYIQYIFWIIGAISVSVMAVKHMT